MKSTATKVLTFFLLFSGCSGLKKNRHPDFDRFLLDRSKSEIKSIRGNPLEMECEVHGKNLLVWYWQAPVTDEKYGSGWHQTIFKPNEDKPCSDGLTLGNNCREIPVGVCSDDVEL